MNKEPSSKEKAIYQAVVELFEEGADLNNLTVAEITGRAGIGKGTAYEYFSDKEEMIAKALFYNGDMFCRQIYEGLNREKNLFDKMNFVLLKMEQHVPKTNCIVRLVHMMSDNSMISRRMQELERKKAEGEMLVTEVVRQILKDEFKDKQEPSEEIMSYLVMSIFSKLLCYGMILNESKYGKCDERETMRKLICRGICREVEEIV